MLVTAVALGVAALAFSRRNLARKAAPVIPSYTSTRSRQSKTFEEAVLLGLANDGGLFCPTSVPCIDFAKLEKLSYSEVAGEIFKLYVPEASIPHQALQGLVDKTYLTNPLFRTRKVTPTIRLEQTNVSLMELFHGPTFAFKDIALQFLGNLFEFLLAKKQPAMKITVVGATSGDTGSSAIHGLAGKTGINCVILFPKGRVSPVQELQMTTVADENVFCCPVRDGTFDDCQDMVKLCFKDEKFRAKYNLAAVNSINWARILAQITYYFVSYFEVRQRTSKPVVFVVPTGNFGDILAGYYAKRMGLPIHKLVVATNENDILDRFFQNGAYERREVTPTITPSMDICVSSNFERFLYHMLGDDAEQTRALMSEFEQTKRFQLPAPAFAKCKREMESSMVTEAEIRAQMKRTLEQDAYLLDPHTAVGVAAAKKLQAKYPSEDVEYVCLATAHWAKFADAVEGAVGPKVTTEWVANHFPQEFEKIKQLPTRSFELEPTVASVQAFIQDKIPATATTA